MPNGWKTIKSLAHKIRLHGRRGKGMAESFSREKLKHAPRERRWMRNPVWPSSCVTPAGASNELDAQNEWEENKHTHTHTHNNSKSHVAGTAFRVKLTTLSWLTTGHERVRQEGWGVFGAQWMTQKRSKKKSSRTQFKKNGRFQKQKTLVGKLGKNALNWNIQCIRISQVKATTE